MSRTRLSEDARFELARIAAARERRNRPRHLLYIAALLVAAAAAALIFSASTWMTAREALRGELARQARASALAQQIASLRVDPRAQERFERFPQFVSKAEEAAESVGLSRPAVPAMVTPDRPDRNGLLHPTWRYENVRAARAEPLMGWVREVRTRIPGTRVKSVRLAPGGAGWTMTVTFTRAERAG